MEEIEISSLLITIGISWLIAFGIGCLIVFIWKKSMDTVHAQTHACNYIVSNSLSFKEKKDRFLYSTVSKVRRQTSSSSGSTRR